MSEYKSNLVDGIHVIVMPEKVDNLSDSLDAKTKTWLIQPTATHLIDFAGVKEFNGRAYRPILAFAQSLKANNKQLFCMNMSDQVKTQLSQDGIAASFLHVKNPTEAAEKSKASSSKTSFNVEFINPFIKATAEVLKTQANTPLKPVKPTIKKPGENIPMEIAGVINLTNPQFTGSISLCFRAEVFLKIYENMVGEKHESINSELEDAAGELLNIIFGQAKTTLNDQLGYTLEKVIPTILCGDKLRLRQSSNAPVIILPFESNAGNFHIEVLVEQNK